MERGETAAHTADDGGTQHSDRHAATHASGTIVGVTMGVNGSTRASWCRQARPGHGSHQLGLDELDAAPGAGAEAEGEDGGEDDEVADEAKHRRAGAAAEWADGEECGGGED